MWNVSHDSSKLEVGRWTPRFSNLGIDNGLHENKFV